MMKMEQLKKYFPQQIQESSIFDKLILKEYLQLMILDFLSASKYIRKLVFIGGTNLRLVKGIDRFSEDIDFDCKNLSKEDFFEMTDSILLYLRRSGFRVESKDRDNYKLTAFRRNIYFPELLFDLVLTAHKDERFLIKVESHDQQIDYEPSVVNVKGCGFFFPITVPPDGVLCSMKISAMLSRKKGRDFYDVLFLLALASPDFAFLEKKWGINNKEDLKQSIAEMLKTVDLKIKMKDFEHLLFNKNNSSKILRFYDFIKDI